MLGVGLRLVRKQKGKTMAKAKESIECWIFNQVTQKIFQVIYIGIATGKLGERYRQ